MGVEGEPTWAGGIYMSPYSENWRKPEELVLLVGNADTEATSIRTKEEFEALVEYGRKFFGVK